MPERSIPEKPEDLSKFQLQLLAATRQANREIDDPVVMREDAPTAAEIRRRVQENYDAGVSPSRVQSNLRVLEVAGFVHIEREHYEEADGVRYNVNQLTKEGLDALETEVEWLWQRV